MTNVAEILNSIGTLLVAVGTVVVLFKISSLITTLSERINEWKD